MSAREAKKERIKKLDRKINRYNIALCILIPILIYCILMAVLYWRSGAWNTFPSPTRIPNVINGITAQNI